MSVAIETLREGQELHCYMRLGLALKKGRTREGRPFYYVPSKPRAADSSDLTRFLGWVMVNNPSTGVITVRVTGMNSLSMPIQNIDVGEASIHYSSFRRVRLVSPVAFAPVQPIPGDVGGKGWKRPGSISSSGSTAKLPYRTLIEVRLPNG